MCQRSSNHKLKAIHNPGWRQYNKLYGVSKIVKSQIESNSQLHGLNSRISEWCVKDRQITNWKQFTTFGGIDITVDQVCQRSSNHKLKAIHNQPSVECILTEVCQRSSNHKLKAIHNSARAPSDFKAGVSKIVKSQIESNSQLHNMVSLQLYGCVKDRQITNWKQFTTKWKSIGSNLEVCQRSSNHKLKAIHNRLI